ncbi:MAG TPA: Asp-tRNA(Asn)/Glu-tRNA(Gln) amidotransferase subunit GatA [Gemmatimonadales bacterium]|nr:Asp-tRNA(Asn)/Glu-tRNA(Gln) amidotransferase subunit GatA [Gemmatimonadales bacterium]
MTDFVRAARDAAGRIVACEARGTHAFLSWSEAALLEQAERLAAAGATGPLAGEVVAVKDVIAESVFPTTCGSKILEGWRSPFEATAVRRLREAGAMVAGKANCDEFAMGSSTEWSAYGPSRNPVDPTRVPGGSSGGSAAAVAAGAVTMALGSETGGSVRQPAAFCGIVGIKPTYGRVSRYGLVAFGSSLDQIGVFGTDVASAARLLGVISGHDDRDATSLDRIPLGLPGSPPASLKGTVIGVPREYFPQGLHAGIKAASDRALARLRDLGAEVRDVSLPHTKYAVPTYYIVAPAEASSNLARYDGVRYGRRADGGLADVRAVYRATRGQGFGPEVRRRILLGTYVLSAGYYDAYYRKAQRVREAIRADFARVFAQGVHALFTPTTPTPAFRFGENTADPLAMYLSDVYVCTANLAWVPALSLPIGRDHGLPIGGQLIGAMEGEATIIRIAQALERAVDRAAEVR